MALCLSQNKGTASYISGQLTVLHGLCGLGLLRLPRAPPERESGAALTGARDAVLPRPRLEGLLLGRDVLQLAAEREGGADGTDGRPRGAVIARRRPVLVGLPQRSQEA